MWVRVPPPLLGKTLQTSRVNFWVDDTDASTDRVVWLGGKAVVPSYDAPGFREAVLVDPQDAAFSVSKLTAGAKLVATRGRAAAAQPSRCRPDR